MQLVVDTHSHTLASGHAYSTIIENAAAAKEQGLKALCTTDHGSSMPGAPHYWFFSNQRVLPRILSDVIIFRGVEANILNQSGELDLPEVVDSYLDWFMAGLHEPVFTPTTSVEHTKALIAAIEGGRIDAFSHLGNPNFDFDFKAVIECAAAHNVAIEINNSSLTGMSRKGSNSRCYKIAEVAGELGAPITTGSDAHFSTEIGQLDFSSQLLDEVGIPEQQIITHSLEQFVDFLKLKNKPLAGLEQFFQIIRRAFTRPPVIRLPAFSELQFHPPR